MSTGKIGALAESHRGGTKMKALGLVTALVVVLGAADSGEEVRASLIGYQEVPSVNTVARGRFHATISPDEQSITYEESYSGLQGMVTQSHIHVSQSRVNGSVVVFLCQTAANRDPTGLAPDCPQEGTVTGTITADNIIAGATASQQLHAGDLASVIKAIRAGAAYANVHTDLSPGGEVRGQLQVERQDR